MLILYPKMKSNLNQAQKSDTINDLGSLNQYIHTVESWLSNLYPDEFLIIELREFKGKSFESIAIQCNYKNHSSVIRKHNTIIKKIRRMSNIV